MMTKEEIKKGLEICLTIYCKDCPYDDKFTDCSNRLKTDARKLIIEQEKRIERLRTDKQELKTIVEQVGDNYNKAFERLKAQQQEIDALKDENKQLKTECTLLDDELRIARQETINALNKLKEKIVERMGDREYMGVKYKQGVFSESEIDEMIAEVLNAE